MAKEKPWTNTSVPRDPRLQVYKEVYLVNDGNTTYKEKVKGDWIVIEPGDGLRIKRHEAAIIRGQFNGDKVEKRLRVVPIFPTSAEAGLAGTYVCQLDGKAFNSQEELEAYLQKLREKVK
jgi:hypothetical protein